MPAPVPGDVLVAQPPMADPNFRRTVILLCEHTTEGSFGLVLNRPTGLALSQAADEALPFDADLWTGGPVQPDTLHYLHPYGNLEGTLPVLDDVFWGGDFEAFRTAVEAGWLDPLRARFFVGYSGWGAGQLDAEVDESDWIVVSGSAELVFADGDDALWRGVLRQLGGEYALLSTFPDDPRLN